MLEKNEDISETIDEKKIKNEFWSINKYQPGF